MQHLLALFFILNLEDRKQCGPSTLGSSCSHISTSLRRCQDGPSGSKAVLMCCSTWASRLSLMVSWSVLTAWMQLKLLHCVDSPLHIRMSNVTVPNVSHSPSQQCCITQSSSYFCAGRVTRCICSWNAEAGGTENVSPQQTPRKEVGGGNAHCDEPKLAQKRKCLSHSCGKCVKIWRGGWQQLRSPKRLTMLPLSSFSSIHCTLSTACCLVCNPNRPRLLLKQYRLYVYPHLFWSPFRTSSISEVFYIFRAFHEQ